MRTVPGVGPITAAAIEAFAPSPESFERGRDFAAWLGLVPKQHLTGGKEWLGRVSKMGQRHIRRLLTSNYSQQSRVEAQIGRWKTVIGDSLRARHFETQKCEDYIATKVLNRMNDLGSAVYSRV